MTKKDGKDEKEDDVLNIAAIIVFAVLIILLAILGSFFMTLIWKVIAAGIEYETGRFITPLIF